MASTIKLSWSGLNELREALRALPGELAAQAGTYVTQAATDAAEEIINLYPSESRTQHATGNLRKGVRVVKADAGRFGAASQVRSNAPHAWLYEFGSQTRQTSLGYNRGAMWHGKPPRHVFVPVVMRHRRVMQQKLIELVRAEGFIVSE